MLCLFTGTCAINRYRCEGGNKCIPLKWICDGVHDCDDKLDERNCFTGKETNIPSYGKLKFHTHGNEKNNLAALLFGVRCSGLVYVMLCSVKLWCFCRLQLICAGR